MLHTAFPLVDALLSPYAATLGPDFIGYRHHILRVLNHYLALQARAGGGDALPLAVQLAVPFHDLGIWTDGTFDYLAPSIRLALAHLADEGLDELAPEVQALIFEHHKLRPYRGPYAATVERYRQADLVDLSLGRVRFGLPRTHLRAVQAAFPNAGFHRRLAQLTARQLLRSPWRPLPMMHW